MKQLFPATILAATLVAVPAMAEVTLGLKGAVEHQIEATKNNIDITPVIKGLPFDTTLTTNLNYGDAGANGSFEYEGLDVDFSTPLTDSVALYIKNDFSATNDHTETTIGVAVNFF